MMTTPPRDFVRRADVGSRRSGRQALALIPNTATPIASPDEIISLEISAMDNLLNSRHGAESWSFAPSPDEQVIQKRGRRRKTIVWSPDVDACKRNSLFSLSTGDRTPVKNTAKPSMVLRSTPRKRLSLGGTDTHFVTPEKKKRTVCSLKSVESNSIDTALKANLINALKGLSHEQLVTMIMDLISMQEDGNITEDQKLRDIITKRMPIADIQTQREKLIGLRQSIYASLVSSNVEDSAYSRAYIHLDAFEKAVIGQGRLLLESQHWISMMQYIFTAWNITKELPEWKNQELDSTVQKCFKTIAHFCIQTLRCGSFTTSMLDTYRERLEVMAQDCADIHLSLKLLRELKHSNV